MSNKDDLAARLRIACGDVRRKSFPIADLIPLMQQCADALQAPLDNPREGWAVVVLSPNGREEFSGSALGILPPVWRKATRRFAEAHAKELIAQGLKARVVPVEFTMPVIKGSSPET